MTNRDLQNQETQPDELGEAELEQANGGIGLLLPAVQKVREAAAPPPASLKAK